MAEPGGDDEDDAARSREVLPEAPAEEQRATAERLEGHGHPAGDTAGIWSDTPVTEDEEDQDRPWPAE